MKEFILILPRVCQIENEAANVFFKLDLLQEIARRSAVSRVKVSRSAGVKEANWLGLDPDKVFIADGPLTIAALGVDPPPRSAEFHLSLLSCDEEGTARTIVPPPTEQEIVEVFETAKRLETRNLKFVRGIGTEHGLVWVDGSIDLRTVSGDELVGQSIRPNLPSGLRDQALRSLIDDSVNLLTTLECNRRRIGEGGETINLLWPWGQGYRIPMPNLGVKFGVPIRVESKSIRLSGLARLCGLKHGDIQHVFHALSVDWARVLNRTVKHGIAIVLVDSFGDIVDAKRPDVMSRALQSFVDHFLGQIWDRQSEDPTKLQMLCLGSDSSPGLGLQWDSRSNAGGSVHWQPEVAYDEAVKCFVAWEWIESALRLAASEQSFLHSSPQRDGAS